MFKGLMTGVSGIRGIVGVGITPEVVLLWAGAFGSWLKGGKIVIGRDPRPTGEMLKHAVKAGLSAAGCDIEDVGMVPTPTAALSVRLRGAAGGIIITASHNPQEWNALKFARPDGRMLTAQDFADLDYIVKEGPLRSASWDKIGQFREWNDASTAHIAAVTGIAALDLNRLHSKHFKVAIDCVNGAGSFEYPALLKALGCEVVAINCAGNGLFPHPPEPLPENLADLGKAVVAEKCQIGFAVDPDGDRLAIVDEFGKPIGEELTLALAAKMMLQHTPGPIVINSLSSQVMEDVANEFNVECHRTRVGEANVASRMAEVNAVIGGEGNGGVIIPEVNLGRDSGVGMALVLNLLASGKKKLSDRVKELPNYKMIKTKMPVGKHEPLEIIEHLAGTYEFDQISRIDGVRVVFEDGWVQARPSNTEPILRVFSESTDEAHAKEMIDDMLGRINKITSKL